MCRADRGESRQRVLWGPCALCPCARARVPGVHIQSPAAATSRQDMEDMDIWAGRHGQWAEEGEWRRGVSHRQAVLLRCLAGLGSLVQGRQLGITALTAFWLQQLLDKTLPEKLMGLILWAGLYGLCCLDADKRMLGNLTKTLSLPENPMGLVRKARRRRWSHWARDLNLAWGVFAAHDLSITAAVRY